MSRKISGNPQRLVQRKATARAIVNGSMGLIAAAMPEGIARIAKIQKHNRISPHAIHDSQLRQADRVAAQRAHYAQLTEAATLSIQHATEAMASGNVQDAKMATAQAARLVALTEIAGEKLRQSMVRLKRAQTLSFHLLGNDARPCAEKYPIQRSIVMTRCARSIRTRVTGKAAIKAASGETADPYPYPEHPPYKSRLKSNLSSISASWQLQGADTPNLK